jgi:VWFA-related protein
MHNATAIMDQVRFLRRYTMRRMLPLLLLALLLLPALPAYAQALPSARVTQVDTSHYPDVTLYVGVTGADGRPVGGLSARDFTVTEDGQPVTISDFAGGGGPVSAVLVIDRSGSMADSDKIEGAQEAARAFVSQMRPGDQTALITFNSRSRMIESFTSSQDELARAIDRIDADGGTALYDSMAAGVDALKDSSGRRALLLLTDGQDCRDSSICPDSYGSQRTLDQAIEYANQRGQPLEVIGLGERGSDERDGIDEAVLRRIADATGGEYFYAPSADQLADLYRTLSAGLQQEYALTYRSPRPFYDGTRRDIRVSVGGAPATTGGYVERHLIDVRSDPLVGLLLLLPILGALLAPTLLWRRATAGQPHPDIASEPFAQISGASPGLATGSTIMQPLGVVVIPPDVARCQACDAPLLRTGARFCSECGAQQPIAPAEPLRRIFCDQCGRPLRAGAHFCSHCGATAAVKLETSG